MRITRVPVALVAIIAAAAFAIGCGPSDSADAGDECKKAANNIPAGQVRDEALKACDNASGKSVQDVKNDARKACQEALAKAPPEVRQFTGNVCENIK
jgi:hypothetical protein